MSTIPQDGDSPQLLRTGEDVISGMNEHLAFLQAEVDQIKEDLKLQRKMMRKYGEDGFEMGEQRLLLLKQQKKESSARIEHNLKKLERTIRAGKKLEKDFEILQYKGKLKDIQKKSRSRRKERAKQRELRKEEKEKKRENGTLTDEDSSGNYSDASSSSSDSGSLTSTTSDNEEGISVKKNNIPQRFIYKEKYVGDNNSIGSFGNSSISFGSSESTKAIMSRILQNKEPPKFKSYFNLSYLDEEKEMQKDSFC
ncbi:hypothetical protein ABK040_004852 [Willaertia magna]